MAEKIKTEKVKDEKNDAGSSKLARAGKKILKGAFIAGGAAAAAVGIGYGREVFLHDKELEINTENGLSMGYKTKDLAETETSLAGNEPARTKEQADRDYHNSQIRDMFTMEGLYEGQSVSNKSTEELDGMIVEDSSNVFEDEAVQ